MSVGELVRMMVRGSHGNTIMNDMNVVNWSQRSTSLYGREKKMDAEHTDVYDALNMRRRLCRCVCVV